MGVICSRQSQIGLQVIAEYSEEVTIFHSPSRKIRLQFTTFPAGPSLDAVTGKNTMGQTEAVTP
jgi:hypothetical protein